MKDLPVKEAWGLVRDKFGEVGVQKAMDLLNYVERAGGSATKSQMTRIAGDEIFRFLGELGWIQQETGVNQ